MRAFGCTTSCQICRCQISICILQLPSNIIHIYSKNIKHGIFGIVPSLPSFVVVDTRGWETFFGKLVEPVQKLLANLRQLFFCQLLATASKILADVKKFVSERERCCLIETFLAFCGHQLRGRPLSPPCCRRPFDEDGSRLLAAVPSTTYWQILCSWTCSWSGRGSNPSTWRGLQPRNSTHYILLHCSYNLRAHSSLLTLAAMAATLALNASGPKPNETSS